MVLLWQGLKSILYLAKHLERDGIRWHVADHVFRPQGQDTQCGCLSSYIVSANVGLSDIPCKSTEKLEAKGIIIEMAGDLNNDCRFPECGGHHDEIWENEYDYKTCLGIGKMPEGASHV